MNILLLQCCGYIRRVKNARLLEDNVFQKPVGIIFIVAGEINLPQKHCRQHSIFVYSYCMYSFGYFQLTVDSYMSLNNTHYIYCCVSNAKWL